MKQETTPSRAVKAAMLSALLFPGSGQVFLGRRVRGACFIVPTVLAVLYFGQQIFEEVVGVAYAIAEGRLSPGLGTIFAEAHRISTGGGSVGMNAAAGVIVACWILSAIDAWRIGR